MSGSLMERSQRTLSRVGRHPIPVPSGVKVTIEHGKVIVEGPNGSLIQSLHPEVHVTVEHDEIMVERYSARKFHQALHGLFRSLIANAITGVTEGYQKTLELVGVGYRAQQAGDGVVLNVGFSHPVEVHPMSGVTITVEGNNRIHVRGVDSQKVGEIAARIRRVRPPDAYKGKGVRYAGDVLRLKPGKAGRKVG